MAEEDEIDLSMNTSIHSSVMSGDKSKLKKLLESVSGELLNSKNEYGQTALMLCVLKNDVESLLMLLKAGAQVDNSDYTGQTPLHSAIIKGHYECMKALVNNGSTWNHTDLQGATALHAAAMQTSPKFMAYLLKIIDPGEIDFPDFGKKSAIHWCAAFSHTEHIKLLMKYDIYCHPDIEGFTSLHWAALNSSSNSTKALKLLLKKELRAINWQDYSGRSVLHLAVGNANIEMIHLLLSYETCKINILDNAFNTPLQWASRLGNAEIAALLLDRGADYDSRDRNGATALHYAASCNSASVLSAFLSRSHIECHDDADGRTPLHWAAANNSDDAINRMAKFSINLSTKDKQGSTPLHLAASQGHLSTTGLLLALKVPVNLSDNFGLTPLLRACEHGHYKVVQLLLENGASLDLMDKSKRNALHWSALCGHAYLCQMLIHRGCVPNKQDSFLMTPLHYATRFGYVSCMSVLLECKTDPNITDMEGKTALHLAVFKKRLNAVKLLVEHGSNVNALIMLEEWATPLDCALQMRHGDISLFLRNSGGVTFSEIENEAAKTIQNCFKSYIMKATTFTKCKQRTDIRITKEQLISEIKWKSKLLKFFNELNTSEETD